MSCSLFSAIKIRIFAGALCLLMLLTSTARAQAVDAETMPAAAVAGFVDAGLQPIGGQPVVISCGHGSLPLLRKIKHSLGDPPLFLPAHTVSLAVATAPAAQGTKPQLSPQPYLAHLSPPLRGPPTV